MAAAKRTRIQREKDLETIAEMYLKGAPQSVIAKQLKVSQPQICYDLREIVERWKERAFMAIDERKAEELAKIDLLEVEYRRAWEDSRKATRTTAMQVATGKNAGVTKSSREITNYGDPRFLQGISWCIAKRCEILGLNAPVKIQDVGSEHEWSVTELGKVAKHALKLARQN